MVGSLLTQCLYLCELNKANSCKLVFCIYNIILKLQTVCSGVIEAVSISLIQKSLSSLDRHLLLCRVTLGKSFLQFSAMKMAHAPPGHHSVMGRPSAGGLNFPEYVVYRGEQAYPEYLITYQIVKPEETAPSSDAEAR
jgi:hypothetical protein